MHSQSKCWKALRFTPLGILDYQTREKYCGRTRILHKKAIYCIYKSTMIIIIIKKRRILFPEITQNGTSKISWSSVHEPMLLSIFFVVPSGASLS